MDCLCSKHMLLLTPHLSEAINRYSKQVGRQLDNNHHHLARFFLIVSLFVMAVSIMAVYSTISASEYDLKKDDMHTHAIVHLVKSNDWLNDYEEQKLGEKILQSQIDNANITMQNNTANIKQANNYLNKYKSYIDTLHADKSVEGSLANLQYKSEVENGEYDKTQQYL